VDRIGWIDATGECGLIVGNGQRWMSFSVEADVAGDGLDWVTWILVSAAGGLVALLFAVAVGAAYRRRHRQPSGAAVSHSALDATRALARDGTPNGDGARNPPPVPAGAPRGRHSSLRLSPGSALIGYVTVAADARAGDDRESMLAIEATCEHFGWKLVEVVSDRDDGGTLERRGLRYALERIADGHAHGLVVSDLQRVSRSIIDLGALMAWFRDTDATLIALDLDIDTSTAEGRHVAATLIALSAQEHQRIASGTRRGLATGRADGHPTGRPAVSDRPELMERIAAMRAANMTLQAIADRLNEEGVPTLRGGKQWRPSSIQAALGYRRPRAHDQLPSPHARPTP
jgi:DNA invertase Pin-like site-specific DNA recombinase